MDNGMTYGRWLRQKRGSRGAPEFVSQDALAERVGVLRTYINQIENGRVGVPDPPLRKRIHAALGTTEAELIDLGIVSTQSAQPARPAHDDGTPDAFIASLTPTQRQLLRTLLDAADKTIHIEDARPEPGNAAVRSIS